MRADLVTLGLFILVVEETSLAKAADRAHLAPSAISKRLADLELDLGVKLFERKPTGMFPTTAGMALLHHARRIMHNITELEGELRDFAGGVRGTIRVRANSTGMVRYLPEDLKTFVSRYPQVRVEIEESTTPETFRAVADNIADIGIYGDVVVPTDLTSLPYRHERLVLIVPGHHDLAARADVGFRDTASYEFIGTRRGSSIDTVVARAATSIGVSLRMTIRTAGFDSICRMVDAGLGIAVIPESVTMLYANSLRLKVLRLDEDWAERWLMLCIRNRETLSPAATAFLAHLTGGQPEPLDGSKTAT
jgi:DNA-binding transcriptional LysR family regulator